MYCKYEDSEKERKKERERERERDEEEIDKAYKEWGRGNIKLEKR